MSQALSSRSVVQSIPFSFVVSLLFEISKIKPQKANDVPPNSARISTAHPALRILHRWISELHKKFDPLPLNTTAIFFRLLFPEQDLRKYDMQESRLAQHLADCLGIQAKRLHSWRKEDSSGCLGEEVEKVQFEACTHIDGDISPLSIAQVDALLNELASSSGFSQLSVRSQYPSTIRRSRTAVLRNLYRSLSPKDASFLTQIILKDLRPLLYPLSETHYTAALKDFNSNAVKMLTKEHAMAAWDPSGCMLKIYRVRATIDEAAAAFESDEVGRYASTPKVGTPIEIPNSEKGRSCRHALQLLGRSKTVWAETKYDGERAQIHVEVFENTSQITIFSKSKRDSTMDRYALHSVIREALGLADRESCPGGVVKKNVVLDAEMVAYHGNHIDEFWRIRSLIESTARGIRGTHNGAIAHPSESRPNSFSQSSLITDTSESRNLALVFFDVLVLDSTSLLSTPYFKRRSLLESLIKLIPGRVMLAERTPIILNDIAGINQAEHDLRKIFARLIADHQEGLVLKGDESGYNDFRIPWVKLKKDYIPGYGDSLDLAILGARWDKERARELRVAPNTYTTFYLGALANADAMKLDPALRPHFHIYFTASYGMSRAQLEEANFLIKTSDPLPYNTSNMPTDGLLYSHTMFSGLAPPAVLLRNPLVAELFGAGFTKAPKSRHYELRFPRITKIFRTCERSWTDSVNLQALHQIARESVGRDRSNKDVDDWCNDLWGKPISPGANCALKRKATADEWEEKLSVLDRRVSRQEEVSPPQRRRTRREETGTSATHPSFVLGPLGTETDVGPSQSALIVSLEEPKRAPISLRVLQPSCELSITPEVSTKVVRQSSSIMSQIKSTTKVDSNHKVTFTGNNFLRPTVFRHDVHKLVTPMTEFLSGALVWFARAKGRPSPCPAWKKVVPQEQQLHSIESLLLGCGWHQNVRSVCSWVEHGVIFVDEGEECGEDWKKYALQVIQERARLTDRTVRRAIWMFDSSVLGLSGGVDVESYKLFRLD